MERKRYRSSEWDNDVRNLTQKEVLNIRQSNIPCWIFVPESSFIDYWSKFMTLLLIYTAIVTPYRVSFIDNEDSTWIIVEYFFSALFFADFLVNCCLAYYDREKNLVCEQRKILSNYFIGWMIPDLFACLPFNIIFESNKQYNSLVRVARIPRLYRLFKITKLLRIAKVMKNSSKILKHMNYILKISVAFERIFWFAFTYILIVHLVACMWVFVGKFDETSINWIEIGNFQDIPNMSLYIVSLYWTITTFTTVGYGDIVAVNFSEKFFTVIVMTIGIIFYSYSISSLTNVLSNIDQRKAKLENQIHTLENLSKEYNLNKTFYFQISRALEFVNNKSRHGIEEFVTDLPGTLGNNVLVVAYEKILLGNAFFEKKSTDFVAWVAPRLKFCRHENMEIIFTEEDYATQMYFITQGSADFVLIRDNIVYPYIEIVKNYYFGEVDLLFSEDKKHLHTTRAGEICEMLTLSKENFYLLLNIYEVEAIDICGKARERLDRTNEKLHEAENSLKNNVPVDKRKTYPKIGEYIEKDKIRRKATMTESNNSDPSKCPTLFKKIIDSKLKIREVHGKIIKKKVLNLEKETEELRKMLYRLQDLVADKYEGFKKKFPVFSQDTSSVDSPYKSMSEYY